MRLLLRREPGGRINPPRPYQYYFMNPEQLMQSKPFGAEWPCDREPYAKFNDMLF